MINPIVLNEILEMIVSHNGCAHIPVVILELSEVDVSCMSEAVPLSSEFLQALCCIHLSSHEHRVSLYIEVFLDLVKADLLTSGFINRVENKFDLGSSVSIELSSKSVMELLNVDLSSVVSVKELVESLEFCRRELMSIHLHSPLELFSLKLSVSDEIHLSQLDGELSDSIDTSLHESSEDLVKDLIRLLSLNSEDRVHVGVVA